MPKRFYLIGDVRPGESGRRRRRQASLFPRRPSPPGETTGVWLEPAPAGARGAGLPEPPKKRIAAAARPSIAEPPLPPPVTRISGTNFAWPSDNDPMTLTSAVAVDPRALTWAS